MLEQRFFRRLRFLSDCRGSGGGKAFLGKKLLRRRLYGQTFFAYFRRFVFIRFSYLSEKRLKC